jgi:transposase
MAKEMVSDSTWAVLEPLLPDRMPRRGGRWRDHRQVIEGIAFKYRVGVPWRDVPERFGPWQTLYERLSRWAADGTWAELVAAVQARADLAGDLDWVVSADASLVRVHQHGAALPRDTGGVVESHESHRRTG